MMIRKFDPKYMDSGMMFFEMGPNGLMDAFSHEPVVLELGLIMPLKARCRNLQIYADGEPLFEKLIERMSLNIEGDHIDTYSAIKGKYDGADSIQRLPNSKRTTEIYNMKHSQPSGDVTRDLYDSIMSGKYDGGGTFNPTSHPLADQDIRAFVTGALDAMPDGYLERQGGYSMIETENIKPPRLVLLTDGNKMMYAEKTADGNYVDIYAQKSIDMSEMREVTSSQVQADAELRKLLDSFQEQIEVRRQDKANSNPVLGKK